MTLKEGMETAIARIYAIEQAAIAGTTAATSTTNPATLQPPYWNNFVRNVQLAQEVGFQTYRFVVEVRATLVAGTEWEDVDGEMEHRIQFNYVPTFIEYLMKRRMLQTDATQARPKHLDVNGVTLGPGGGFGLNSQRGYVGFEIPILLSFTLEMAEEYP